MNDALMSNEDLWLLNQSKRILVTGGSGYVGSVLIPELLRRGHTVTNIDALLYGNYLPKHERLTLIEGDIRNRELMHVAMQGIDCVIHLACISNDPSFDLDPGLGRAINLEAFVPLIHIAKSCGVRRFINASSSSVYGVKDLENVTENETLDPLTDYSKYKAQTEELLYKATAPGFETVSIRSATVCGYSPRQRLDVIVNILTNDAYHKGEVRVFGGEQKRPNIHIKDIAKLYADLVTAPAELINGEVFNYGGPNYTVNELATLVCGAVGKPVKIHRVPSNDLRSYHISSEKIKKIGFEPKHSISNAVIDLCHAFDEKLLRDTFEDARYYNIKTMKLKKLG